MMIAGLAGNICVLFTANDAYMRGFKLFVPGDCTASNSEAENKSALEQMKVLLKADIRPWQEVLEQLCPNPSDRQIHAV